MTEGEPNASSSRQFTRVTSARELPNGTLLVGDHGENVLAAINFESGEASDIAREGSGPGEFRSVGWLYALPGDSTLLTDGYHGRWNVFAGTRFVESYSEARRLNYDLSAQLAGVGPGGLVAGTRQIDGMAGSRAMADSLEIVLADRTTAGTHVVGVLRGLGSEGPKALSVGNGRAVRSVILHNPLASEDQVLLFPDGWLAVARVEPYRVDLRMPDGRWRKGQAIPGAGRPTSSSDKCHALEEWFGPMDRCDPSILDDWPQTMPPFLPATTPTYSMPLLVGPNGNVGVRRTMVPERSYRQYDVIGRSGRKTAEILVGIEAAILTFGEKSVYLVTTDDVGLQTIGRYDWVAR